MENESAFQSISQVCDIHASRDLMYYCYSCQKKVCSDCIFDLHSTCIHDMKKEKSRTSLSQDVQHVQLNTRDPDLSKIEQPGVKNRRLVDTFSIVREKSQEAIIATNVLQTAINDRAEEMLRFIKKARNQLLEECQLIRKQNNVTFKLLEKNTYSNLNIGSEKDKVECEDLEENKNISFNQDNPQFNIPIFKSGVVDMISLKGMFGTICIQKNGNEREHMQKQVLLNEHKDMNFIETGDIHSTADTNVHNLDGDVRSLRDSSNNFQNNIHLVEMKENKTKYSSQQDDISQMQSKANKSQEETERNVHFSTETSKEESVSTIKQNPKLSLDFYSYSLDKTEENNKITSCMNHDGLHSISQITKEICILEHSIEFEDKPICCLCVVDIDTCWIHQGITTANFIFNSATNKRKKIDFKFVVEDWVLKPPNTLISVDYNNRIVKLSPLGSSNNLLTATQNVGWSFHHVDLHPIAIASCKNGDYLVSLVNELSYKVDNSSRRQVVRMNDAFELLQVIEHCGTKRLFTTPRRLAENTNGDICVLDETSEHSGQILVLEEGGTVKFVYTGHEDSEKAFNPNDLCCDGRSRIIILDYTGNRMHILDQNGQFLQYITHTEIINPYSIAVDKLDRYWIGLQAGKIVILNMKKPN